MMYSSKWKEWVAQLDFKTCLMCKENHGKIYDINEFVYPEPPIHPNCIKQNLVRSRHQL